MQFPNLWKMVLRKELFCLLLLEILVSNTVVIEGEFLNRDNQEATFTEQDNSGTVFILKDPSYLIITPRIVRPGQMYRLVVNIQPPSPSLVVRATLFKDNIQLDVIERECHRFQPHLFQIMVPSSSTDGNYRLKIEGNEVGWLTGSAFTNETSLIFTPRDATVLIQTDKKIYDQGAKVMLRIIVLDSSVKMIQDSVDVFILSPRGVLVKRWLSRQCSEGSIPLEFALSNQAEEGKWKIRVEATNTFSETEFVVESFQKSLFEVDIDVPAFLSTSMKYLEGTVTAQYPSGAPVAGNVTVRAALKPLKRGSISYYRTQPTFLRHRSKFNGQYKFQFLLTDMGDLLEWSEGLEVRIIATVGDALLDATSSGFASVRIFGDKIILKFLGESPSILRPSMPYEYYLTASLFDGSHVSKERLSQHRLQITPEVRFKTQPLLRLPSRTVKMRHDQFGLWNDELDLSAEIADRDIENDVESVTLKAELKDSLGFRSYSSLVAIPHHSSKGNHIQLSTSTKNPKVGEYIILHVRSNYFLDKFYYIIMSKGSIIDSGQERMQASLKTFPLALTFEMSGSATVIIYSIGRDEELVADSLTFPVDPIVAKDLKVYAEEQRSRGKLKITITGEPGTRVTLTGSFSTIHKMQLDNSPTKNKIMEEIIKNSRPLYHDETLPSYSGDPLLQKWFTSLGSEDDYSWVPKPSVGSDANETFTSLGLDILSDGGVPSRPNVCKRSLGLLPCLVGGCYASTSSCDRKWDCVDRIDENGCGELPRGVMWDLEGYQTYRKSRVAGHFLPPWLWTDVLIGNDGYASISVPAPEKSSELIITAFGVHKEHGISLLPKPAKIVTKSPYWMWVEVPERVVLGEQVGVRVTIVNRLSDDLPAVVVLTNNPSYRFVSLEDFVVAQTFTIADQLPTSNPVRRMLSGEHEHSMSVPAKEARTIYLPIVPVITGIIPITVQAALPGIKISKTIKLLVEPEGAKQEYHTSLLLDLNSRAYLFTFMDIKIPNRENHQHSKVRMSLFGDTVGGISDKLINSKDLGLPEIGCEPLTFSFLMSLLQLKHWKELKQKPDKEEKKLFKKMAVVYQALLSYQNNDGGFKSYETSSTSSVWVTSLVLRTLNEVSINWPLLLYVDPQVTDRALRFLLKQQSQPGAFWEPDGTMGIRQMEPASSFVLNQMSTKGLNLSSTAFTLIQLLSIEEIPEPLDEHVRLSIEKGRSWLERNLGIVAAASHPLEVSLVALALHLTKSVKGEEAFGILSRNARQEVKYVYWGEDFVALPSYRVESKRPHLQPRKSNRHDAGNVAATACALRVYAARGEVLTPAIVRWLQYQRAHDLGWISTLDTLLAWEALHEHSMRNKESEYTHLRVTIEPMQNNSKPSIYYVNYKNVLQMQSYEYEDVKGSMRVQGKGNGTAVLQLTAEYFVSDPALLKPSPDDVFVLRTTAVASGRNSSTLTFNSCIKWKYTDYSKSSGITVLEVDIPTGYGLLKNDLKQYVRSKKIPTLKQAQFSPRKITFFFEKIGTKNTCIRFSVHRWFPVANLTKTLLAKVYEYYSPELFTSELLDMSSITLDICQVCGSYQCPNCPILSYYSSGSDQFTLTTGVFYAVSILCFYISFFLENILR